MNKGHAQHLHDIILLLPYPSHSFPLDPYFNKLIRIMSTRCMMPAEYFCSGEIDKSQVSSIFLSLSVCLSVFLSISPSLSLCLSLSLCVCVHFRLFLLLSISLFSPLSFCVFAYVCVSVSNFVSLSLSCPLITHYGTSVASLWAGSTSLHPLYLSYKKIC